MNLSAGHRFDKDVELLLYYENTHQPTAVVEAGAAAAQTGRWFYLYMKSVCCKYTVNI